MRCGSEAWRKSLEVGQAVLAGEIRSPHALCEKWLSWRAAGPASAGQRHREGRRPADRARRVWRPEADRRDLAVSLRPPLKLARRVRADQATCRSERGRSCDAAAPVPEGLLVVSGQGVLHLHAVRLALRVGPTAANSKGKSTTDRKSQSAKKHMKQ